MQSENRLIQTDTTLYWVQPKFAARYYQLFSGNQVLAELAWTRWFSDSAQAVYGKQCWNFERVGFWRNRIQASIPGSNPNDPPTLVADFQFEWFRDGWLELSTGRRYLWHRTHSFRNAWALVEESGQDVFGLEFSHLWFKQQAAITLLTGQRLHPQLQMLLCLGMYIAVSTINDSTAVAAAASSASSS